MSHNKYAVSTSLLIAAALAVGTSNLAFADDSSMRRFGGDSYAYFNQPSSAVAADPSWRQSHPDGISTQEFQVLSSSALSAAATRFNAPVFARAAADPSWREAHPNGFTERELQALSSSPLAIWQSPGRIEIGGSRSNLAQSDAKAKYAF